MGNKSYLVDQFLGLNEAADSQTELKSGQATKMVNFLVTDGGNLTLRPGVVRLQYAQCEGLPEKLDWAMPVHIGGQEWILGWRNENGKGSICLLGTKSSKVWILPRPIEQVFFLNGQVWLLQIGSNGKLNCLRMLPSEEGLGDPVEAPVYVPLVREKCNASGEGQNRESLNILTDRFRIRALGDGVSAAYKLSAAVTVESVLIDGKAASGSFLNGVYTFEPPPEEGSLLEFYCRVDSNVLEPYWKQLLNMPYSILWGEEMEDRCFFYGDGSNACMYTGVPSNGEGLYVPVENRLTIDRSAAPVTGLVGHYSRLLVFKPDGVDLVTHTEGERFALRPVSRQVGNDVMGQLQLVENSPRSFTRGGIYDWRMTQSAYRDERYAVRVSDAVSRTLSALDVSRCVSCDDGISKTYYVFTNDEEGTVLVHRYGQDAWMLYRSQQMKQVKMAFFWQRQVVFLADGQLRTFDSEAVYDQGEDNERMAIPALWESGYQDFGLPWQRKHSAQLWISLLSQPGTDLDITARTDRNSSYGVKNLRSTLMDFSRMDFSRVSFVTFTAPRVHRVKLKVKKFVYYKLILRLDKPGAKATVLSYEQKLR